VRQPKAILFDLDCTLIDRPASLALYAGLFVNHFRERLRDAEQLVLAQFAQVDQNGYLPRATCWARLRTKLDWTDPASDTELDDLWKIRWPGCALAASDARQTLEHLAAAGYALGIITNGPAASQEAKIDTLGIRHLMRVVLVSEAVGVAKPARAIFRQACRDLGLQPCDVWFVGDNPVNDVIGSRGAGLVDVWMRGHAPWPEGHRPPTYTVDRLGQLLEILGNPSRRGWRAV
jgi:putative hydrolase of the HAD superfamily